jgi:hypothetical protein
VATVSTARTGPFSLEGGTTMSLHVRVVYDECDGVLGLPFRDFHLPPTGVLQRTFRRRILVPNPIRPSDGVTRW